MRDLPFSSFKDLTHRRNGREVALFGAGDINLKTVRKLGFPHALVVDNNPNMWNTVENGVPVKEPEALRGPGSAKYFVVICTTSFVEVAAQLQGMGFRPEADFMVSPILNDLRIIGEIEGCKAKLLFSSGSPPQEDPAWGGGIYALDVDGGYEHRKVYSGNCHGILRFGEGYVAVDDNVGLIELDRSFRIKRSAELPARTRGHGIAFSERTGCFYVVSTYSDRVIVFDKDFKQKAAYPVSGKFDKEGSASHHCNDVCVVGDSIYVSMFSMTGNWKRDVFDGAVLELDADTGAIRGPVISDLWMPHNISFIEGSLVVLDSLRGELRRNNAQPVGRFPGFSRGLAYDGSYYYVGQSRNRNYSKFLGLSLNISIDTSVIVFDESTKVSRSLQLPGRISEVHAVIQA